jgi:hypothetical protein
MPEILRSGIGYVDAGVRYGYTDGTLWYLGETRMYWQGDPRNVVVLSYGQLQSQVDTWIATNPAARATKPTSDETRCGIGFQGVGIHSHEYWYQNYIFIGKSDPSPYSKSSNLVRIFQYPPLGVAGVGFGYADGRMNTRQGYSDSVFWYKGECRLMRVSQLPVTAKEIPTPITGPVSGIKYYQSSLDGRTYVTASSGEVYVLFDYAELKKIVDEWERANQASIQSQDWFAAGFLWLGQGYWQTLGSQALPDEFALALSDCERNLATIIKWLPGTKISSTTARSGIAINLPQWQNRRSNGFSLSDLLMLQYLQSQQSAKKKKKKKTSRRY